MVINFLVGNLILRKNKTGVHLFHESIIRKFINAQESYTDIKISTFGNKRNKEKEIEFFSFHRFLLFSNKITRILSYFMPIEFFFGKADVYICDGLIPITLHKSCKVAVIHDLMVKIYPQNYKFLMKLYLNYYFFCAKRADYIIAVSNTTKKDIVKYLGVEERKIKVIYNGIELLNIKEKLKSIENIRFDIRKKYLFYIGDLRKNKNLISAIKGFALYAKTNFDAIFYIAGNKNHEYKKLYNYVREHNLSHRVFFLGYVNDAEKFMLYKNAFAFLFVSYYEGFGVPILEAMACETPVISSNCSSMKEIAEQAAILVEPDDVEEIAKAIHKLDDFLLRKSYIKKGKILTEIYTWDHSYHQFVKFIKGITD